MKYCYSVETYFNDELIINNLIMLYQGTLVYLSDPRECNIGRSININTNTDRDIISNQFTRQMFRCLRMSTESVGVLLS